MGGQGISIDLLGALVVRRDGVDVTAGLPGRKGRTAVAYLALQHPAGATRDDLIDVLWSDRLASDRRANLRTLLSRIRDVLGSDALVHAGSGPSSRVGLVLPDEGGTDLARARALVSTAREHRDAGRLTTAARCARDAVGILDRRVALGLEGAWVDRLTRSLDEDLVEMLICVADLGSQAGGEFGDDAVVAARQLAERDGYLERGHAYLMKALARRGEPAEALRVYDLLHRRLHDELGTGPAPVLRSLRDAISRGEDVADPASPGSLPGRPGRDRPRLPARVAAAATGATFVGREQELRALIRLDRSTGTGRVVTVTGPPGIGKSSLVARAAVLAERRGHVVLFGRSDELLPVRCQALVEAFAPVLRPGPTGPLARSRDGSSDWSTPDRISVAALEVLRRLARDIPVTLVLDDLQWADPATCEVIRRIEGETHDVDVALVLVYRDTGRDGVAALVEEIRAERDVLMLRLDGLDDGEMRQLAEVELGHGVPKSVVEAVLVQVQGNPLFAREIIRDLRDRRAASEGWPEPGELAKRPAPPGVRQLVLRGLASVPEQDREVIRKSAGSGEPFRLGEIADRSGVHPGEAANAVEVAARAGLVAEVPDRPGEFAFTHPLIRQVLAGEGSAPSFQRRVVPRLGDPS